MGPAWLLSHKEWHEPTLLTRSFMSTAPFLSTLMGAIFMPAIWALAGLVPWADSGMRQTLRQKISRWFREELQPTHSLWCFKSPMRGDLTLQTSPSFADPNPCSSSCCKFATIYCSTQNFVPTSKFAQLLWSENHWIGLDLFNDDTRPSGHISRPAQVNVSQSGFHSLNNYSSLIILYTSGG